MNTAPGPPAILFGQRQTQMIFLLAFLQVAPPIVIGEFASRTECEQRRAELLAGEPRVRVQLACLGPRDQDRR